MARLTISRILLVFATIVTLGLVAALCVQTYAMKHVQIEGPLYDRIALQRELVADLVPPPLFQVEAYAAVYEATYHADRRGRAIERIMELKRLYDTRKAKWSSTDLPLAEREIIETKLIPAAERFWFVVLDQFLPAIGKKYDTMMAIMDDLARAYQDQRHAVLELDALAKQALADTETAAVDDVNWLGTAALAGGLVSVLLFVAGIVFVRIRAIAPLSAITDFMGDLAAGTSEHTVPFMARNDEIGAIAKALEVFRVNGVEKAKLELEASAEQTRRAQERADREEETAYRAREISHVVGQLGSALKALAHCDLRIQIQEGFGTDFDQVRRDFNDSIVMLQQTLQAVMDGTHDVSRASAELSAGADQMSRRAEQQAAALEEASAALEEITATVSQLSNNTRETRQLVGDAHGLAVGSAEIVSNAVDSMQRIERSALEIAQIIGVIDEIAFQTNLLALNAGVEAARAGDSGKGFAVVATEVRELAQRSAGAALQIRNLIETSTSEVKQGVEHVARTGKALNDITSFVTSIDAKVNDIVVGIQQQSIGLRETSAAIHALDGNTQQNAAMAEEAAAMSSSLSEQASGLAEAISKFQLDRPNSLTRAAEDTRRRFAS